MSEAFVESAWPVTNQPGSLSEMAVLGKTMVKVPTERRFRIGYELGEPEVAADLGGTGEYPPARRVLVAQRSLATFSTEPRA